MASDFTIPSNIIQNPSTGTLKTVTAISLAPYLPGLQTFSMATPGTVMLPHQAMATPHQANILQHQAVVTPHQGNLTLNPLTPGVPTATRCSLATGVTAQGATLSQTQMNFPLSSAGLVQYPSMVSTQQPNMAVNLPGMPVIASVTSLAGATSTSGENGDAVKIGDRYSMSIADHSEELRTKLFSLHTNKYLHDAFITVSGQRVLSAHRVVLAAFSAVFNNVFSMTSEVKHVVLPDWTYEDLKVVIDAMYTGILELHPGNIDVVLDIIKKLTISSMQAPCDDYLARRKDQQDIVIKEEIIEPTDSEAGTKPIEIVPCVEDEDRSKEEGHEAVKIKTEPPDTTEKPQRKRLRTEATENMDVTASSSLFAKVLNIKQEKDISHGPDSPQLNNQNPEANSSQPMETNVTQGVVGEMISVKQEARFPCEVCGKDFPFYSNLKLHQLRHGQPRLMSWYTTSRRLLSQQKKTKGVYKCKLCQKVFKLRIAGVKHMEKVHFSKAQCKQCHKQFLSFKQLQIHMYSRHKANTRMAMNCTCLQCGRVFRHQKNADKHTPCGANMDRCAAAKLSQTVCEYCNQKFRHPRLFQRHKNMCILKDLMKKIGGNAYNESKDQSEEPVASGSSHTVLPTFSEVTPPTLIKAEPATPRLIIHPLKPVCEDSLFQTNILGDGDPDQLVLTMMYMVYIYFSSSRNRRKNIYRDQLQVQQDEKGMYIRFHEADEVKGHKGPQLALRPTTKKLYANEEDPKRCFVRMMSTYLYKCPKMHDFLSPFFLVAKKVATPCYWYNQRALGQNTIDKIQKHLSSLIQKESRKICSVLPEEKTSVSKRNSRSSRSQTYIEIAPAPAVPALPILLPRLGSYVETERCLNEESGTNTPDKVPATAAVPVLPAWKEDIKMEPGIPVEVKQILTVPKTCVKNLQNWLRSDGDSPTSLLRSVLRMDKNVRIEDLEACQLYFLLKHLVAKGKLLEQVQLNKGHTVYLAPSLQNIVQHYTTQRKSKSHLFEETSIQSILTSKGTNWRPNERVLSLEDMVSRNVLGDKDPEMLLQSVAFLMSATFQLTSNELLLLSRSMVVLDSDKRGRYLCVCRCEKEGIHHSYSHVVSAPKTAPADRMVLFKDTPLKVYEKPGSPQSCLVHLMSTYLSKSPTVHLNLFLQPVSSRRFKQQNVWWYRQQAVGRQLMGVLLNAPLKVLSRHKDTWLDAVHSQALMYGEYQPEECVKCAIYSQDQRQ